MIPIDVARNIRRLVLRWPSEQINGLAFTLGIIDHALRSLRGEQTDFKFLPRPAGNQRLITKRRKGIHPFPIWGKIMRPSHGRTRSLEVPHPADGFAPA